MNNNDNKNDFGQLADDLENNLFKMRVRETLRPHRHIMFAFILFALVGLAYLANYLYQRRDLTVPEQEAYAKNLVAKSSEEYKYNWTEDGIKSIQTGSDEGVSLDDVIETFGKPSKATVGHEQKGDMLWITYQKGAFSNESYPREDVSVGFVRYDGIYRAIEKIGRFPSQEFKMASELEYQYLWTQEAVDNLKRNDFRNDEGEIKAEDIVTMYGSPRQTLYVISEVENTLFLDYPKPHSKEIVSLLFLENEKGDFILQTIFQ